MLITPQDQTNLRMLAYILMSGATAILVFALFLREVLTHPVDPPRPAWADDDEVITQDTTEPDFV